MMRSVKALTALVIGLVSVQAGVAAPVRVVILSGANVHDWKATTPLLEEMYNNSPRFNVVRTTEDVGKIDEKTFAGCNVIVSNWTCHPVMTGGPWTQEGKTAFEAAIRKGAGMVSFHAACAACNDWADFQEICGLTWKLNHTSHTAIHTFKVVVDSSHPITKGMPDFWTTDELYQRMVKLTPAEFTTLAKAFAEPAWGGTAQWEPVLITTKLGKGRGVNFLLGHDVRAMQNVAWQTIMLRATEWAATGRATISIPDDWPTTAAAAAIVGADIDAALKTAGQYAHGGTREALSTIEQWVIAAHSRMGKKAAADRARAAARLAEALASAGTPEAKSFFCRQLAMIANPRQVPVLAPLLADARTAMMARYALEQIPGLEAGQALRDALPKLQGKLRIGIINSIGTRADAESAAALGAYLNDPDQNTAAAATAALGKIGTAQAADLLRAGRQQVLDALRAANTDALMNCAEQLMARSDKKAADGIYRLLYAPAEPPAIRAAALHGIVIAQPTLATMFLKEALAGSVPELNDMVAYIIRTLPKTGDTRSISELIVGLEPRTQVLLISALADRGNKAAAGAIRRATVADHPPTRVAALAALGRLGDESEVAILAEAAATGSEAERAAARSALAVLPGDQTTAAIVQMLLSGDPKARSECARALVARNAGGQVLELLDKPETARDAELQAILIRVLPGVGSDDALAAVRTALKNDTLAVKDAALDALAAWSAPVVIDDLVQTIRDDADGARRPALVQALLRLLPKASDKSPAEIVAIVGELLKHADRPEGRQAAVEVLGTRPAPEALALTLTLLKDPAFAGTAAAAAVKIASSLADTHKDAVAAAMREVIAASDKPELIRQADDVLQRANRPVNLARGAAADSPDDLDRDGAAGGDQAGIDGNPATYWDEVDNQKLYRYRLTFPQPTRVSAISIKGHAYESHVPKDFEILCDDKIVQTVRNAVYDRHNVEAIFTLPTTTCTRLELKITGYYGGSPAIRELEVYEQPPSEWHTESAATQPAAPSYSWDQKDTTLALLNGGRIVWRWNYAKNQPKVYFDPLNLPDGTELVWLSPPDHPWHFALWFSWKEINGLNYWEQWNVPGQGRTDLLEARATVHPDFFADMHLALGYHPDGRPPILTEQRTLKVHPPDGDGAYRIDWTSAFTAGPKDVHLKGGMHGGGYAGLSVRISPRTRDWQMLTSDGVLDLPGPGMARNTNGGKWRWLDFSLVGMLTNSPAGITIFDHPSNLRYPSQWHCIIDDNIPFGYFSPAPLWSEPYILPAGRELILRYRILVHPGRPDANRLEQEFRTFTGK